MGEINQIITYGAGVVALAFIFKLLWDYQGNLSKTLLLLSDAVQNNTKAMTQISESLQKHDNRAQEMDLKIENVADTVETRMKEACYANQVIRDKVVEISAGLKGR